ncbi:hypothetical protein TRAPUB_2751 [Trametes pubescens]|uniref:C2H2-type domain-containing protein n=1 Tax=Trametes pubescens TaxID=154538 RepID=A0A1M2VFP6_TRAPU|nr:hypothetical protein TRAPUB_2751 [Trametes pubescens]
MRPPKSRKQPRRPSQKEVQPQPGPSSVICDDANEGKGKKCRRRSIAPEVKSTQKAAYQVDKCGLRGCTHSLTDNPRENKKHIKAEHYSNIPRKPNMVRPLVGILRRRGEPALSRKDVLKCAADGALMCIWDPDARGSPCGTIFEGDIAQASLARHVETTHWKRMFGCDACEFTTNNGYSLKRHKDRKHNGTKYASGNYPVDEEDEEEEPSKKRRGWRTK